MDSADRNFNQNNFNLLRKRMNLELESISVNQLHELASEASKQKLIAAHGYRGGQYELLCNGEFLLFSPKEAVEYLQDLLKNN